MQKDPFLKLSPTERTFFFVKATEGTTVMHDVEQVTYEQTKHVLGCTAAVVFYDNKRTNSLASFQLTAEIIQYLYRMQGFHARSIHNLMPA